MVHRWRPMLQKIHFLCDSHLMFSLPTLVWLVPMKACAVELAKRDGWNSMHVVWRHDRAERRLVELSDFINATVVHRSWWVTNYWVCSRSVTQLSPMVMTCTNWASRWQIATSIQERDTAKSWTDDDHLGSMICIFWSSKFGHIQMNLFIVHPAHHVVSKLNELGANKTKAS